MDLRRMHDTLTSLAVSAMLTSAVLSTAPGAFVAAAGGPQPQALIDALSAMRAAGWSGTAVLSMPEPVAAPEAAVAKGVAKIAPAASPLLSKAQLNKMLQLNATIGSEGPLLTDVTRILGLTTGDQVLRVREISYTDDNNPSAPSRYFGPLPNGEFLFIRTTPAAAWIFRADKDLNLITAVENPLRQPVIAMPIAQAQQMLREELQTWSAAIGPVAGVAEK